MVGRLPAGLLALALASGCGGGEPREPVPRDLGVLALPGGSIHVIAILVENPLSLSARLQNISRYRVVYELKTESVELIALTPVRGSVLGNNGAAARQHVEQARLEQCSRGEDLVFAVIEPGPRRPFWIMAHPLSDGSVQYGNLLSLERSCAAAAITAPSALDHLARIAQLSPDACEELDHIGQRPRAIACALRHGNIARYTGQIEPLIASGDAQDDLLEALLPTGPDQRIQLPIARRFLAPLSKEARRDFVAASLARCGDAATRCSPSLVTVVGQTASELDDETCDAVIALAGTYLTRADLSAATAALGALRWTRGCGSDERRLPHMRAGLSLVSADAELRSRFDRSCAGATALTTGDGTYRRECPSLPRFSGAWLAERCVAQGADPESVAIARALLTPERMEPLWAVADPITDGAIRVLASCAPDLWHELLDGHPHLDRLRPYHVPSR